MTFCVCWPYKTGIFSTIHLFYCIDVTSQGLEGRRPPELGTSRGTDPSKEGISWVQGTLLLGTLLNRVQTPQRGYV